MQELGAGQIIPHFQDTVKSDSLATIRNNFIIVFRTDTNQTTALLVSFRI